MGLIPVYGERPLEVRRGRGDWVWDDSRRYLDLTGGVAVNVLGHAAPEVAEAVARQASELCHASNLFESGPATRLAELLGAQTRGHDAFLCNSGAEANEAAYKAVRRWAHREGRDDGVIVAFEGGFHGRTMGALSLTHKPAARGGFGPVLPQIEHVAWDSPAALEAVFDRHDVVGVFTETVQGESGVHPMSQATAAMLTRLATKHRSALVVDEVQTGIGRCGTFWAHTQLGLQPDGITSAKGLGGGLPIGAALLSERLAEGMDAGSHGSTFGGNPVSCAAAIAVLETVAREDLARRASLLGARFLKRAAEVGLTARGRGLLLGASSDAAATVAALRSHGILATQAGPDTVRLAPSLRVSADSMDEAVETLAKVATPPPLSRV